MDRNKKEQERFYFRFNADGSVPKPNWSKKITCLVMNSYYKVKEHNFRVNGEGNVTDIIELIENQWMNVKTPPYRCCVICRGQSAKAAALVHGPTVGDNSLSGGGFILCAPACKEGRCHTKIKKQFTKLARDKGFTCCATNHKLLSLCEQCHKVKDCRKCSRCRGVSYCSTDCQRQAWPKHKLQCKPKASECLLYPPLLTGGCISLASCATASEAEWRQTAGTTACTKSMSSAPFKRRMNPKHRRMCAK